FFGAEAKLGKEKADENKKEHGKERKTRTHLAEKQRLREQQKNVAGREQDEELEGIDEAPLNDKLDVEQPVADHRVGEDRRVGRDENVAVRKDRNAVP